MVISHKQRSMPRVDLSMGGNYKAGRELPPATGEAGRLRQVLGAVRLSASEVNLFHSHVRVLAEPVTAFHPPGKRLSKVLGRLSVLVRAASARSLP